MTGNSISYINKSKVGFENMSQGILNDYKKQENPWTNNFKS